MENKKKKECELKRIRMKRRSKVNQINSLKNNEIIEVTPRRGHNCVEERSRKAQKTRKYEK